MSKIIHPNFKLKIARPAPLDEIDAVLAPYFLTLLDKGLVPMAREGFDFVTQYQTVCERVWENYFDMTFTPYDVGICRGFAGSIKTLTKVPRSRLTTHVWLELVVEDTLRVHEYKRRF